MIIKKLNQLKWLCLLLAAPAVQADVDWGLGCGEVDNKACGGGNWEYDNVYYNLPNYQDLEIPPFFFNNQECDLALANINGTCRNTSQLGRYNGVRHIYGTSPNTGWIGFAMRSQRIIQADQVMNWTTIFGTHNSFSNYQDGAFDAQIGQYDGNLDGISKINLNVDQRFSMTDQMDMGARVIRLDPISYSVLHWKFGNFNFNGLWYEDNRLRMCHQSADANDSVRRDIECNFTSYGRLFSYGVNEVADWIKHNPGEVLVMRLNRTQASDMPQIDFELYNGMTGVDASILNPVSSINKDGWDPATQGWPTLREMRSMNKSIIVLSDKGSNATFPWSYVMQDGYTDAVGFSQCKNQDGVDMRITPPPPPYSQPLPRAWNNWSYIGEDRSASNFLEAPDPVKGGAGLLDAAAVKTATNCGFGLINVDFLLAGDAAPKLEDDACVGIDVTVKNTKLQYCVSKFNAQFTEADRRREAAIWSWAEGEYGTRGPAFMNLNGRWYSGFEKSSLHFACAVGQGNSKNPANYKWIISVARGMWSDGPKACKAEGGTFWAPQSAVENYNLNKVRNNQQIWLNFKADSKTVILEPITPQVTLDPINTYPQTFVVNLTQGQQLPAGSLGFQYTAGAGGAMKLHLIPTSRLLLSPFFHIDSRAKTVALYFNSSIRDNHNNVILTPGSYRQSFEIAEDQGGGYATTNYSLVINVAPPAS